MSPDPTGVENGWAPPDDILLYQIQQLYVRGVKLVQYRSAGKVWSLWMEVLVQSRGRVFGGPLGGQSLQKWGPAVGRQPPKAEVFLLDVTSSFNSTVLCIYVLIKWLVFTMG